MSALFTVELPRTRFAVGDHLAGLVRLSSREDPRVASLREVNVLVRARVHSEHADETVVAFHDELSARGVVADEYPFECTLPDGPITWPGHVVHVEWEVRLRVLFHRGDDLVDSVPFVLAPRAAAPLSA